MRARLAKYHFPSGSCHLQLILLIQVQARAAHPIQMTFPNSGSCLLLLAAGFTCVVPAANAIETDDISTNVGRSESGALGGLITEINETRRRVREALGLRYSVTYHQIALADPLGDDVPSAWGGDLTLQGTWSPEEHWSDSPTSLHFRMRNRHAIGDTAPSALGPEIGALWGVTDGFSDGGFEVPDFYFQRHFPRLGIDLRFGQMTIDSQFDAHHLRGAKQSFLNQAFAANPAVAFPRYGAGLTGQKKFGDRFDIALGASTVQGTQRGRQVDFELGSDDLFVAMQAGWTHGDEGKSRLQLMLWHIDAVGSVGQSDGFGASFTWQRELESGARSFARLACADGDAASVDLLLSGGIAMNCREKDLAGFAIGVGRGSGGKHPLQASGEFFYRWQPREGLRVSPDLQVLFGDGFDEGPGLRIMAGLRLGIDF